MSVVAVDSWSIRPASNDALSAGSSRSSACAVSACNSMLIRKHLYAIRVDRMQASNALTRLAIVEERRQHWCSSRELAAYLGVPVDAIRKAARAGLIPHYRRPGAGRYGEIRVRANNFCLISEHFR
jgi:hypothetical protein